MTLQITNYTPKMSIDKLPGEALLRIVGALDGIELAQVKTVSKFIKRFVVHHENYLYERCIIHQYPAAHSRLYSKLIPRIDWKNLFIILDQDEVSVKHAPEYSKVILEHKKSETLNIIFMIFECALSFTSTVISIAKVATLGLSATRLATRTWLSNNPGKTVQDAFIALGFVQKAPPQIIFDPAQLL